MESEILFEQRSVEQRVSFREKKGLPAGVLFEQGEPMDNIEPNSQDPQILEERNMDKRDPDFKKKLAELDRKLKDIEDPDEAWYLIETSFLRDHGYNGGMDENPDKEVEQRIVDFEIAHGTRLLAAV